MKKLILVLLLLPAICFAQKKNDTKIVAHANDTTNLFNRVALLLIEEGYSFETKDTELKFIRTTEKALRKRTASSKVNVIIKDSLVIFSGLLRIDFSVLGEKPTFSPVKYREDRANINNVVWREIEAIANKVGGYLAYEK